MDKENTTSVKFTDNEIVLIKQTIANSDYRGCISYVATAILEKLGATLNSQNELR